MRVLFHIMVIVPMAMLAFASFLLAIAWSSMREAVSVKVPVPGTEDRGRAKKAISVSG